MNWQLNRKFFSSMTFSSGSLCLLLSDSSLSHLRCFTPRSSFFFFAITVLHPAPLRLFTSLSVILITCWSCCTCRVPPSIHLAVLTCSLLADVGQVVVAGDVVPFAILVRDHHHAVLSSSEEVVWLVFTPVLILLRTDTQRHRNREIQKHTLNKINCGNQHYTFFFLFKLQLNIISVTSATLNSDPASVRKNIFSPSPIFSFDVLHWLCDLFVLHVIIENENTTVCRTAWSKYNLSKPLFKMNHAAIMCVSFSVILHKHHHFTLCARCLKFYHDQH